jgi:hypothetical protein
MGYKSREFDLVSSDNAEDVLEQSQSSGYDDQDRRDD